MAFRLLLLLILSPIFQFSNLTEAQLFAVTETRKNYLQTFYLGFHWAQNRSECNDTEFHIIAEALRVAAGEMLDDAATWSERIHSAAFNRFFISPYRENVLYHWLYDDDRRDTYIDINESMDKVKKYVRRGKFGRPFIQARQIGLTCIPQKERLGCKPGTAAKTHSSQVTPEGYTIVLCPTFFDGGTLRYANDPAAGPVLPYQSIGQLNTFEHVFIHELFHAGVTGVGDLIGDAIEPFPSPIGTQSVYGASLCAYYARQKLFDKTKPGVNMRTRFNADNYAWYFTNAFFAKRFDWSQDDGTWTITPEHGSLDAFDSVLSADSIAAIAAAEDFGMQDSDPNSKWVPPDDDSIPRDYFGLPPNCQIIQQEKRDLKRYCADTGGDLDAWLANLNEMRRT